MHYNVQLISDPDLFILRMAKKSGLPKDDYPAFEHSQEISKTKEAKFCMVGRSSVNTLVGLHQQNGKVND